jgi:hypothetical protein
MDKEMLLKILEHERNQESKSMIEELRQGINYASGTMKIHTQRLAFLSYLIARIDRGLDPEPEKDYGDFKRDRN